MTPQPKSIQPKFKVGQRVYSGGWGKPSAQIVTLVSHKVYDEEDPRDGWIFRWPDGELDFSPETELEEDIEEHLADLADYVVLEYLENYCGSEASRKSHEGEHRCDCSNTTVRVTDLKIPSCQPPLFEFLAVRYPEYMKNVYDAAWLHDTTFQGTHTIINNIRILNISSGYEVADVYGEFLKWTPQQSERHQEHRKAANKLAELKTLEELAAKLGKKIV